MRLVRLSSGEQETIMIYTITEEGISISLNGQLKQLQVGGTGWYFSLEKDSIFQKYFPTARRIFSIFHTKLSINIKKIPSPKYDETSSYTMVVGGRREFFLSIKYL